MAEEYEPWKALEKIPVNLFESLLQTLRSVRPDGKNLYGTAGIAIANEIEHFVLWKLGSLEAKRKKRATKEKSEKLSAEELDVKDKITKMQTEYKKELGFALHRASTADYKRERSMMIVLLKSYEWNTVWDCWIEFLNCGKNKEDKENKYIFNGGTFASFNNNFNRLMSRITKTKSKKAPIIPPSFKG